MSALSPVLRRLAGGQVAFLCPGCESLHTICIDPPRENYPGPLWDWDGEPDKPTFKPSILVRWHELTIQGAAVKQAWLDAGKPDPEPKLDRVEHVCHSFVTAGEIRFLGDCTHHLRNRTVELPKWN
jgi:hypothetical protein